MYIKYINQRLERHMNQGRAKSAKHGIPWEVVLQLDVSTKSEAMILEKQIKKRGARRYMLEKYFSGEGSLKVIAVTLLKGESYRC